MCGAGEGQAKKRVRAGMSKESEITMSSNQQKLRLAGTFALLATLALTVSCTGFFVNPTLSSIAVGPASPTIETGKTGNTVQMTVFGTNNDGSTTNNPSVSWTITPTSVATISASGLVTSVSTGTATVTATANQNPSITGTQTVTVTVGCITSITLSQTSGTVSNNVPTLPLMANAATCNGSRCYQCCDLDFEQHEPGDGICGHGLNSGRSNDGRNCDHHGYNRQYR